MSPSAADSRLQVVVGLAALIAAALVAGILLFLLREAWPVLQGDGWRRFFTAEWYPLDGEFGLWPMLLATVLVTVGALILAVPLGLACAIFDNFFAPAALRPVLRGVLALMAGIPSVVYGFWGLTVLVPLIARWEPPGASLLAAVIILALMILPTVALVSRAALAAVPAGYLQAASALSLPLRAIVFKVAMPAAKVEIAAGVVLAAARALGETMAVLMVAGNVVQIPSSLFDPVRVLTANMALEMAYATGDHRAGLFVSGLMLTALVTLLALLAHRLTRGLQHD